MPTIHIDPDFEKLLPPLSPEEAAELEATILADGVREPLIIWQDVGTLLDGHNRKRIAEKHDLPYLTTTLCFADREAARLWIIRNQLSRRNLKPDAASYLRGLLVRETPRDKGGRPADNSSKNLTSLEGLAIETGVTRQTLHNDAKFADAVDGLADLAGEDVRALVLDGQIPKKDTVRLAGVAKTDPDRAKAAIGKVRDSGGKDNARQALATVKEDRVKALADTLEQPCARIICCDFRQAEIADGTADLIFTDPPYGDEYLPLWNDLGIFAARVLKPGGLLLALSGKSHIIPSYQLLAEHLRYYWTCAIGYEDAKRTVFGVRFWGQWRPVLCFSKGDPWEHRYCNDMLYLPKSERPDQELHPWQQSSAPADYFIDRLSDPGQLVVDPMCGTGAYVASAIRLKREAIGFELDPERHKVAVGLLMEAGIG
jgi:hypothetical protein